MMVYLALLPILLLLVAAAALIIIRIIRPATSINWLIAALAAFLAWLLMLLVYNILPQSIGLFRWQPEWLFSQSPRLLVDRYSWAFSFSLTSLILAAILTDAARSGAMNWFVWTANLILCAIGVMGVQAGNLLTLVLIWTAIDMVDVFIYLAVNTGSTSNARFITSIFTRAAGTFLLIWTIMSTGNTGMSFEEFPLASQTGLVMLVAAILRSGVIPLRGAYPADNNVIRSLGTVSRLTTAATGLILVTRAASVGIQIPSAPVVILIAGLVAIYCAVSWVFSKGVLDAQPYWILGLTAFAIASALRSQPDASTAWSMTAILTGGLLAFFTVYQRYLIVLPLIGLLGITALPFTPAWNGVLLYTPEFIPQLVLFMLSQPIFILGYLNYSLRQQPDQGGRERWVRAIYPLGLAILPVSHYIAGWLGWTVQLSLSTFLPGLLVSLMAGLGLAIAYRLEEPPRLFLLVRQAVAGANDRLTMEWAYQRAGRLFSTIGRSISFVTTVFEGDGGVLWALFFLVLFIAILIQIRLGV